MRRQVVVAAAAVVLCVCAASAARADEPAAVEIWKEPSGTGVGFGFSNGIWGSFFGQDIRVRVPLGDHWAAQVRGLALHGVQYDPYRFYLGARLGIQGSTSPMLNFVRVYGGGGAQLLAPLEVPDGEPKEVKFGLGGEFGLEVFLVSSMSFFFEIGGNGFIDTTYGSGGTAMAGMNFYPY